MTPIDIFKELIKIDDTTPLERVIELVEKLDAVYEQLVVNGKKNSELYAKSINEVVASAEKLEKQIESLDATEKEQQEQLVKSAAEAEKLLKKNEQYTQGLKEEEAQLASLVQMQAKLQGSSQNLNKTAQLQAGSLADLKKKLKEATDAYYQMGTSTDAAVKQDALDRITQLSKGVAEGEAALKQAKKSVDLAAGSYDKLSREVAESKRQLKAMEGGIGSNSKEFLELQARVKTGTEQLKKFDKEVGDNQRNVGNYSDDIEKAVGKIGGIGGALGGISPQVGAFTNGIEAATRASLAFLATPLGLILGGIALALASVTAYFKSSQEAEDEFTQVTEVVGVVLDNILDIFEELGGAIVDFIKPLIGLGDVFDDTGKKIGQAFSLEPLQKLGEFIVKHLLNQVKALYKPFVDLYRLITGEISIDQALKELANTAIQLTTGVENGVDKIAKATSDFYEKSKKDAEAALKIAALEARFRKETLADIVDDAETELATAKLLATVKDKLRFSDEERLAALQKANKLLEDQVKGDVELAQLELKLAQDRAALDKTNFEENKKIAELKAKVLSTETQFFEAQKRRLGQESALIAEIAKEREDKAKRELEAERNYQTVLINGRIAANKAILSNERSTLDERLNAVLEIANEQQKLSEVNYEKQLQAERSAALERVQLNSDTLDQIYGDASTSLDQKLALEKAAREELITADETYVTAVKKLDEELAQSVEKTNDEMLAATQDNVFKQYERDAKKVNDQIATGTADAIVLLNEAFASEDGLKNIEEYNRKRQEIQDAAQLESLTSQINYLKQQRDLLAKNGYDTTALSRQIAEAELAISDAKNKELLDYETKLQESLKELKNVAIETAFSVLDSVNEREDMEREEKLAKLEANYQNELALAEGNDAAKAALTAKFNAEKKKIEKEQAEANKRRAIFDKGIAAFQIGINTAQAIASAVAASPLTGGLPFSAIAAAIGALQLAAVLAKPIPQFAVGTESSPEGLAWINEEGTELLRTPGGKFKAYDSQGPVLAHLERGTKVYPAEQTRRILDGQEVPDRMVAGFDDDTQKLKFIKVQTDTDNLERAISNRLDELIHVTRTRKAPPTDLNGLAREITKGMKAADFYLNEYR
jgi:hypothetical protein